MNLPLRLHIIFIWKGGVDVFRDSLFAFVGSVLAGLIANYIYDKLTRRGGE